jgi:hypothetical protein
MNNSYDIIDQLPVDNQLPTHDEINLINTIFKKEKTNIEKILEEFKSVILIGILYILLSLNYIDNFIKSVLPITLKYPYIIILLKAVVLMLIVWVINNYWLLKKN